MQITRDTKGRIREKIKFRNFNRLLKVCHAIVDRKSFDEFQNFK